MPEFHGDKMRNFFYFFLLSVLVSFNFSCSRIKYQSDEQYNPEIEQIESISYSDYFELKTSLPAQQLELVLVANLNKEALPITYQIKKHTRRLSPNDYMIASDVNLYLNNLSNKDISIELLAVSVENKHLPHSQRKLNIPANESFSLNLGRIPIDSRLNSLYTTVEYISSEHQEKSFDMKRIVRKEKKKEKTAEEK